MSNKDNKEQKTTDSSQSVINQDNKSDTKNNETEIVINDDYKKLLPEGYDVIGEYQDNIEQSIVDNLFDYFGRTYYKSNSEAELNEIPHKEKTNRTVKVRNNYLSSNDKKLFNYSKRTSNSLLIAAFVFLLLAALGWVLYGVLAGTTIDEIKILSSKLALESSFITYYKGWIIFFIFWLTFICFLSLMFIVFLILLFVFLPNFGDSLRRIKYKNKLWNKSFDNFAHSLTRQGIVNAIQASIPEFVLDKHTPIYDRLIHNIHKRIYNYANIPDDAHQIEFACQASGFYKGCPFSLSHSKWEWFREAKIIKQEQVTKAKVNLNARRSLRRFEDTICVLVIDTYAEPKLNFVLNNPDGRNIRLQNEIFNKVFSLAVNNPAIAYTTFTPYVQHTLARCKTWSPLSRAIRQVIKEGSKIYVVFDGRTDFFKFDRIVDPNLNYVFNTAKVYESFKLDNEGVDKKQLGFPCGSLDQTASLMTEYILEEIDLLFSALEMGTCYPYDDLMVPKSTNKTLYDVLNERKAQNQQKFAVIDDLNDNFYELENRIKEIDFNNQPLNFKPLVNIDIKDNNKIDNINN